MGNEKNFKKLCLVVRTLLYVIYKVDLWYITGYRFKDLCQRGWKRTTECRKCLNTRLYPLSIQFLSTLKYPFEVQVKVSDLRLMKNIIYMNDTKSYQKYDAGY